MAAYLIDTDWVIDALAGVPRAGDAIRRNAPQGIAVSIITYGEAYEGAFGPADPRRELGIIRTFLQAFDMLPLTDAIMERFAQIRSDLRRSGNLIPDMDLLIAATAVEHNLVLMTRNLRHFNRVPALRIYQPT